MIKSYKISIVGAGGLGIPLILALNSDHALKSCGIDISLQIIDPDIVHLSNLHRQILFYQSDIGRRKVDVLKDRLDRNGSLRLIEFIPDLLNEHNIHNYLSQSELILDATDSVQTKFLLNDYAFSSNKAFCYGGALGYQGQLLFADYRKKSCCACLRCLFPVVESEADLPTCSQAGILGPVVGHIGFAQAELCRKFVLAKLVLTDGSIFYSYDSLSGRSRISQLKPVSDCPLHSCGRLPEKSRIAPEKLDLSDKPRNFSDINIPTEKTPHRLDLTKVNCPHTFLYSKLALERLTPGDVLEVSFGNKQSLENVRDSLTEQDLGELSSPPCAESGIYKLRIKLR